MVQLTRITATCIYLVGPDFSFSDIRGWKENPGPKPAPVSGHTHLISQLIMRPLEMISNFAVSSAVRCDGLGTAGTDD